MTEQTKLPCPDCGVSVSEWHYNCDGHDPEKAPCNGLDAGYYEMKVFVTGHDLAKSDAIVEAARAEWNFRWSMKDGEELHLLGEGELQPGETEEHFVRVLTSAIWRANQAYCGVNVVATCLDNAPWKEYRLSQERVLELVLPSQGNAADGEQPVAEEETLEQAKARWEAAIGMPSIPHNCHSCLLRSPTGCPMATMTLRKSPDGSYRPSFGQPLADQMEWLDEQAAKGVAKGGPHVAEPNHEDDVCAKVAHEITLAALCCHEALHGYWDRNDEGFEAMKNGLERALTLLGYPMPDYAKRDEEEGFSAGDEFTFERRPLTELPHSDVIEWLADIEGDDQSVDSDTGVISKAVELHSTLGPGCDKLPETD